MCILYNQLIVNEQFVRGDDTIFQCKAYSFWAAKSDTGHLNKYPLRNHKVFVCKPYKRRRLKIVAKEYTNNNSEIELIASKSRKNYYVIFDRIGGVAHRFILDSTELIPKWPDFRKRKFRNSN